MRAYPGLRLCDIADMSPREQLTLLQGLDEDKYQRFETEADYLRWTTQR